MTTETVQNMSGFLPSFSIQDLLDCRVHLGHDVSRWLPQVSPYLYGIKNGIHIINLNKTHKMDEICITGRI